MATGVVGGAAGVVAGGWVVGLPPLPPPVGGGVPGVLDGLTGGVGDEGLGVGGVGPTLGVGGLPLLTGRTTVEPEGTLAPSPGTAARTWPAGADDGADVAANWVTRPTALSVTLASALDLPTTGGTTTYVLVSWLGASALPENGVGATPTNAAVMVSCQIIVGRSPPNIRGQTCPSMFRLTRPPLWLGPAGSPIQTDVARSGVKPSNHAAP